MRHCKRLVSKEMLVNLLSSDYFLGSSDLLTDYPVELIRLAAAVVVDDWAAVVADAGDFVDAVVGDFVVVVDDGVVDSVHLFDRSHSHLYLCAV